MLHALQCAPACAIEERAHAAMISYAAACTPSGHADRYLLRGRVPQARTWSHIGGRARDQAPTHTHTHTRRNCGGIASATDRDHGGFEIAIPPRIRDRNSIADLQS